MSGKSVVDKVRGLTPILTMPECESEGFDPRK
jgi:hypothetical protein